MCNLYKQHAKHYLAVDCIIFGFDQDELKLLLIKRNFEPHKGKWSLMGGFVEQNESMDAAALRVLESLTGLKDIYLEQLYTYGDINRDAEVRVISTAYFALIKTADFDETALNHPAKWFSLAEMPELIFDHNVMVDKALRRLNRKSKSQPIGFELLPDKFTIPQLQALYEAIWMQELDKRNFRKKILATGVLKKLDEKEKESSKKGAFFYQFDTENYNSLIDEGYVFEL
jgi:8-oxo-dGTP diphosphatase